jgi:hypothetical protein
VLGSDLQNGEDEMVVGEKRGHLGGESKLTSNDHKRCEGGGSAMALGLVVGLEDGYFRGIHCSCMLRARLCLSSLCKEVPLCAGT